MSRVCAQKAERSGQRYQNEAGDERRGAGERHVELGRERVEEHGGRVDVLVYLERALERVEEEEDEDEPEEPEVRPRPRDPALEFLVKVGQKAHASSSAPKPKQRDSLRACA